MNEEDKKIKDYGVGDVQNINMEDYIPSQLIKLYPYRAVGGDKTKVFLEPNSTTFVSLSQFSIENYINLKEDEDGNLYTLMYAAIDNNTGITISSEANEWRQELRKIKSFTAIISDYIDTDDDKPDFFTIGKPLDEDDKKQQIYYAKSITPSTKQTLDDLLREPQDINDDGTLAEVRLMNVVELEESVLANSKLIFSKTANIIENVDNIKLVVPKNVILDKVKAKGIAVGDSDEEFIDVDFKVSGSDMVNMHVVPIDTKDKLTVFFPWFDKKVALSKTIADSLAKQNEWDFVGWAKSNGIDVATTNMILNIFCASLLFSQSFGTIIRNENGSIDPKESAFTDDSRTQLAGIANSNPINVIDGIYRTWRKKNPFSIGSNQEKLALAFLAASSEYIQTSLAVAGGENDFNKNILPWTIEIVRELKLTKTGNSTDGFNYKIENFDFTINKESFYFDFDTNKKEFINKTDLDISEVELIEADRTITLPQLPESISAIDKISSVGDVSTSTSKDLKYMLKLPLSNNEMDKLFKTDPNYKPGKQTINFSGFSLDEKINPYTFDEAEKLIKEKIKKIYPDASNFNFIKKGKNFKDSLSKKYHTSGKNECPKWLIGGILANTFTTFSKINTFSTFKQNTIKNYNFNEYLKNFETHPEKNFKPGRRNYWWYKLSSSYSTNRIFDYATDVNRAGQREYYYISWFKVHGSDPDGTVDSSTTIKRNLLECVKRYYGINDYNDINIIQSHAYNYQGAGGSSTAGFKNYDYEFRISTYTYVDWLVSFETNLLPISVDKPVLYDRPKHKELIKSIVNVNEGLEKELSLEIKYGVGEYELRELTISSIFGDSIEIKLPNRTYKIPLVQKEEETTTTQKIKFY